MKVGAGDDRHGGAMKAITICQPYADEIVRGLKVLENRTWATSYRGPVAIHAGRSRWYLDPAADVSGLTFGAVVALARLADCRRVGELPRHLQSRADAIGPWCWVLEGVRPIVPVPARGSLGLWEWSQRAGEATC